MSVDRLVFFREWDALTTRFNRDMNPLIAERYLTYVDEHLTTDQFAMAAQYIFSEDTYWPSPARFVEVVHGSPNDLASKAWDTLLDAARKGNPFDPRLDAKTLAVLSAIGGWNEVAYADERRLPFMQKDFVKRYAQRVKPDPTHARLAGPTLDALTNGSDDDI